MLLQKVPDFSGSHIALQTASQTMSQTTITPHPTIKITPPIFPGEGLLRYRTYLFQLQIPNFLHSAPQYRWAIVKPSAGKIFPTVGSVQNVAQSQIIEEGVSTLFQFRTDDPNLEHVQLYWENVNDFNDQIITRFNVISRNSSTSYISVIMFGIGCTTLVILMLVIAWFVLGQAKREGRRAKLRSDF